MKLKLDLDSTDTLDITREVTIPTPDGRGLKIKLDYVYRDRDQMAELIEEHMRRGRSAIRQMSQQAEALDLRDEGDDAAEAWKQHARKMASEATARDVDGILQVARGWNIDAPFGAESVAKLCRKYPGAAAAILTDYRVTMTEGRLGN